ncbi:MAG: L,D-transpeptidase family protein [Anaerolineales bacterium]|nr:L,D-transpeptidase family protein [Anaerolineales bacterium]
MSNQQPATINDNLRLGIEAARTGRENEARSHLIAVLRQDPNNIPAMLWLAFVLPSPQDTIRLLNRVLALDPSNERAKAGIRWARVRLGLPPEQSDPPTDHTTPTSDQSATTSSEDSGEESIRSLLLSEEVQEKAKKGALAHRARRTINPFLGIFLITGALGLMAIGLGALLFVPPETLAAWMPAMPSSTSADAPIAAPVQTASTQVEAAVAADPVVVTTPKTGSKSLTSATDTVVLPEPPPHIYQPPTIADSSLPSTAVPLSADLAHSFDNETKQVPIDPSQLIGPVGPFPPEKQPIDHALLAHQPAYPGEKWIEVDVTNQKVTAWEGDVPVMSFTVSTGLPNTPTVLGKFNIYWKLTSTLMVGSNYYLPEVPYTMYFYAGYALHGTYWHSNFGQPMSHGCVNLETGQAKQLFEWANPILPPGQTEVVASANNPGTLVVVHE